MAGNVHDVVRNLHALGQNTAQKLDAKLSPAKAGYHAAQGFATDEQGHVNYVNESFAGAGPVLMAIYDMTGSSTTGNIVLGAGAESFTPVDYDRKIYDPSSLVTTGSGWKLTAAAAGWYEVTASIKTSAPVTWSNNDFISLFVQRKNAGGATLGTLLLDHDVDVNSSLDERHLIGTRMIYLAATDYLYALFDLYSDAGLTWRTSQNTSCRIEVKYWPGDAPVAGT